MALKAVFRYLILMVCVLVLSACAVQPNSDGDRSTRQTSDSTAQATQNVQIPLNWQSAIVRITLNQESLEPKIFRLTYDSYRELIDKALEKHGDCDEFCYSADVGECRLKYQLKSIDYSEDFFSENSLLFITFWHANDEPFSVGDVTYEGDVLTCTIDRYEKQLPDLFHNSSGYY